MRFLSTPSARRATILAALVSISKCYFYPRPPRGGRPICCFLTTTSQRFLSTPSARRATSPGPHSTNCRTISIHALREEGDAKTGSRKRTHFYFYPRPPRGGRPISFLLHPPDRYFYPRPPRGGRPVKSADAVQVQVFLSTPSARRATAKTETKSLFSNKLYNILHEFRRALIYNGSKNYPNHAK